MEEIEQYRVGDLVVGIYDFMEHLYYSAYYPDDVPTPEQNIGVIVAISDDGFYFGEHVYTVLCIDGMKRFFLGDELMLL